MAAANGVGGDGCARGSQEREGKREPEEGERSRGRGENAGRLWVSPWRREDAGEAATAKQEVEAWARARRHASASRQRLKTAVPLVGWAAKWTGRGGCASTGERQVVFPALFYFFLFLQFVFDLF